MSVRVSTFQKILPVTLTSFINKSGELGLKYFPMLLVDYAVPVSWASWSLGLIRVALFIGIWLGGELSDRKGYRFSMLLSFAGAGFGLILLCLASDFSVAYVGGLLAALGQGLFMSPARMLLVQLIDVTERKEGLAWFRSANNGALVLANIIAGLMAPLGLIYLFAFDAVTSLGAFLVGLKLLPAIQCQKSVGAIAANRSVKETSWPLFLASVMLAALMALVMEAYFSASAYQAKANFGTEGVRLYSQVFMANTFFCMLFAVYAARWIKREWVALACGAFFEILGLICLLNFNQTHEGFFVSVLFQTLGEIIFMSVSLALIIETLPQVKNEGRIYSFGLLVQGGGKIAGGALAIPALIYPSIASAALCCLLGLSILLVWFIHSVRRPYYQNA
jgi:MFS family permease